MKQYRTMAVLGAGLSMLVGLWHFFVPQLFQWYSYIPRAYENLAVGINWTNLCFSFLLLGLSALVLCSIRRVFQGDAGALRLYGLLAAAWVFRVGLAVFDPWPLEPIAWVSYLQLAASVGIMLLLCVPLIKLILCRRRG
nr:hypothetical protein [Maliibacterium massiliense]